MKIDIKVNMTIEEYEAFMKKNLPELYDAYSFIVDKMTNEYHYDEPSVKSLVLSNIIPMVNEFIKKISEKNKGENI